MLVMKNHFKKIVFGIIAMVTLLLFLFYFAACSNDITSSFGTIRAKNIELTSDDGEILAKVKAVKEGGKTVVQVLDKDGNLMGTFQSQK